MKASDQAILNFILPMISGLTSLISSVFLSSVILREKTLWKPRNQLLLGLSLLDTLGSLGHVFSTLPGPAEIAETTVYPVVGTIETCTAQGFLFQLGTGAPLYNVSLCIYYIMIICYNLKDDWIAKRAVPIMHVSIGLFVVSTSITALVLKLFNYAGVLGCYIHHANRGCELLGEKYCERGQNAEFFEMLFAILPIGASFGVVFITMAFLFFWVRRVEVKSRKWRFPSSQMDDYSNIRSSGQNEDEETASNDRSDTTHTSPRSHDRSDTTHTSPDATQTQTAMSVSHDPGLPMTQRTLETGILYSGSFILVYLPICIVALLEDTGTPAYSAIRTLSAFLFPLQGFFNMLIYTNKTWLPWLKQKLRRS